MPRSLVVPLDRELEQLLAAAAAAVGLEPVDFAILAVRRQSAHVLRAAVAPSPAHAAVVETADAPPTRPIEEAEPPPAGWVPHVVARPTPTRVLETVALVLRVSVEALVGPSRARPIARARATALYLLHEDAGLTWKELARLTHRTSATVRGVVRLFAAAAARGGVEAEDLQRCRSVLSGGQVSAQQYAPRPWSPETTTLLPALVVYRRALRLTQPELARRAGLPCETVARLEGLKRRAKPATARALATALGVPPRALAGADGDEGV